MSDNHDAFFEVAYDDDEVPPHIPRDRYGRPMIVPPEGGKAVPYTRMSTMAGYLERKDGLHVWDVRNVVRGMGLCEDVAAMAAALPALTGDKRKDAATNARLSELADMARTAAGADKDANWGTAVHGFTEPGMENAAVPERMQADVRSYWDLLKDLALRVVASEVFVVNDEFRCAGTFDDLYWSPFYELVVGDKKTGKRNIHSTMIQLAGYANSVVYVYDPETKTAQRFPLTSLLPEDLQDHAAQFDVLNTSSALYVHIPQGEGRTEIYDLPIDRGYEGLARAAWNRDYQRDKSVVRRAEDNIRAGIAGWREQAMREMDDATTVEEMRAIHEVWKYVWTPELTAYGRARLEQEKAA